MKIDLPFDLPFDLSITQYKGDSPSHARHAAVDFSPLGLDKSKKQDFVKYIVGYLQLIKHMQNGWLRLNMSATCWHYHYELIQGVNFAGAEVYSYNAKTKKCEHVYGTPHTQIDLGKYGSSNELSQMIDSFINLYFDTYYKMSALDVFTSDFWGALGTSLRGGDLRPSALYFSPAMISPEALEPFLQPFSGGSTYDLLGKLLPGGFAEQKQFFADVKGVLLLAGIVGGAAWLFNVLGSLDSRDRRRR